MKIVFTKKRDYKNFKRSMKAAGMKRNADWVGGWNPTDKIVPRPSWSWDGAGWDSVKVIVPRWVVTVNQ